MNVLNFIITVILAVYVCFYESNTSFHSLFTFLLGISVFILMLLFSGLPCTFKLDFQRVEGYPVDLYYLMDLSYSMEDDLRSIKTLGNELFNALQGITKKGQIGDIISDQIKLFKYYLIILFAFALVCLGCPRGQGLHFWDFPISSIPTAQLKYFKWFQIVCESRSISAPIPTQNQCMSMGVHESHFYNHYLLL